MSDVPFSYEDFMVTREKLITDINALMTDADKDFLLSFESGNPDWANSDYAEFEIYPSVKWKLLNLAKLKKTNPAKLTANVELLRSIFYPNGKC